jgi:hypothetical protein
MLNVERTRKLIAALRSDAYAQARGVLRVRDHYCCLGAARELYRLETGDGHWVGQDDGHVSLVTLHCSGPGLPEKRYISASSIAVLVPPVIEWYGFRDEVIAKAAHLPALNDTGSSFAEIADVLERELQSDMESASE